MAPPPHAPVISRGQARHRPAVRLRDLCRLHSRRRVRVQGRGRRDHHDPPRRAVSTCLRPRPGSGLGFRHRGPHQRDASDDQAVRDRHPGVRAAKTAGHKAPMDPGTDGRPPPPRPGGERGRAIFAVKDRQGQDGRFARRLVGEAVAETRPCRRGSTDRQPRPTCPPTGRSHGDRHGRQVTAHQDIPPSLDTPLWSRGSPRPRSGTAHHRSWCLAPRDHFVQRRIGWQILITRSRWLPVRPRLLV